MEAPVTPVTGAEAPLDVGTISWSHEEDDPASMQSAILTLSTALELGEDMIIEDVHNFPIFDRLEGKRARALRESGREPSSSLVRFEILSSTLRPSSIGVYLCRAFDSGLVNGLRKHGSDCAYAKNPQSMPARSGFASDSAEERSEA